MKKIDGPKTRRIDVKQCRMTPSKAISSISENYSLEPPSKLGVKIDGPKTRRIDVKQRRMTPPKAISSISENYPLPVATRKVGGGKKQKKAMARKLVESTLNNAE